MKFDLSVYQRLDCYFPLGFCLFDFLIFLNILFDLFGKKKNNNKAGNIIGLISTCFLFTISAIHLSRGGIYLLFEDESDQIEIKGIVEETIEIDAWTSPKYDGETNY